MIKNFSTAMLMGVAAIVVSASSFAQVKDSDIEPNAPEKYVVKRGDTLWSISRKYVKNPWQWPELWKLNREQVRNPHLIYPGDVLLFDRANRGIKLGKLVKEGPQEVDLPRQEAIPSIPAHLIRPFLSRPLIVSLADHNKAPYVVASNEGKLIAAAGDKAYVKGIIDDTVKDYYLYRPGKPLRDPDPKKAKTEDGILGYEAEYVGLVRLGKLDSAFKVSTFIIQSFEKDIRPGDRLLPAEKETIPEYIPHAPTQEIKARVVGVYGENGLMGSPNSIVVIDAGKQHGVEFGHVLGLQSIGKQAKDPVTEKRVKLPDERNGEIFVFKVFDKLSYGLIMRLDLPVQPGDKVTNP